MTLKEGVDVTILKKRGGTRVAPYSFGLPPVKAFSAEWCIIKFLEGWTTDDVRLAIDNWVDLAELVFNYHDEANPILGFVKGSGYDVNAPWVNPDNALRWFKERLPEFYAPLVERSRGEEWIRWNMDRLKKIL